MFTATWSEAASEELRAEAARQRITQRHIARKTGNNNSHISRTLTGARRLVIDDFADISIALGVHPVDMLSRVAASIEGAHQ